MKGKQILKSLGGLALTVMVSSGALAQGFYPQSRDFRRLDQEEQDFVRYDDDYRYATDSYRREAADRARRSVADQIRFEADYVFLRQSGNLDESLSRARRYRDIFVAANTGSFKQDVFRGLTNTALEGAVLDAGRIGVFSEIERRAVEVRELYVSTTSDTLKAGYEKVFYALKTSATQTLAYDLRHMSRDEVYRLERSLGDKLRWTSSSLLQGFYQACLDVIRTGDGGGGYPPPPPPNDPPRPVALRISGNTTLGQHIELRGSGSLSLLRDDAVNLTVQVLDQYGNASGPQVAEVQVIQQASNVRILSSSTLVGIQATHETTGTGVPAIVRVIVRTPFQSLVSELSIRVTKAPFKGFDRAVAEKIVRMAYNAVLFREPDAGGFEAAVNEVVKRQWAGWKDIVGGMAKSPEFLTNIRPNKTDLQIVEQLYRGLLLRNPDFPGAQGYVVLVSKGKANEAAAGIGSSQEFIDRILNP